jgi:Ca2+-transporting ATPase
LAAILLLGFAALTRSGADIAQARTAVFVTLVAGVYLLTLVNSDPSHLLGEKADRNPWLRRMAVGVTGMLVFVVGVPFLRNLMGLAMPDTTSSLATGAMVGISALWLEGSRRINELRQRAAVESRRAHGV